MTGPICDACNGVHDPDIGCDPDFEPGERAPPERDLNADDVILMLRRELQKVKGAVCGIEAFIVEWNDEREAQCHVLRDAKPEPDCDCPGCVEAEKRSHGRW